MEQSAAGSITISFLALLVLSAVFLSDEPAIPVHQEPEPAETTEISEESSERVVLPPPPPMESLAEQVEPTDHTLLENPQPERPEYTEAVDDRKVETVVETVPDETTREEVTVDREMIADGRVLLRMISEGNGPQIEIGWPARAADRDRLYELLTSCYGMVSAILTSDQKLYRRAGTAGEAWSVNRDRYSDFLREAQGRLPAPEKTVADTIRRKHGVSGKVVRLLPRNVDAGVVGALFRLANQNHKESAVIKAEYAFDPTGLVINNIEIHARHLNRTIHVPTLKGSCTR